MKSLKELLLEKLENTNADQIAVEEYINANYRIDGKLTFVQTNGVCVVNCDGDVFVKNKDIEKLTDGFVWGEVKGDFVCLFCNKIKYLEGSPEEVGGDFDCSYCKQLESLEGAPQKVKGYFSCYYCKKLKSLEGAPEYVGGNFRCEYCKNLKTLKGAPEKVGADFICTYCENLISLEGAPKNAKGIKCDARLKIK